MRVSNFRMELQSEQLAARVRHRGNARDFRRGGHMKARGSGSNRVEVAHPDLRMLDAVPQRILAGDRKVCDAVFAALTFLNLAAQMIGEELVTVADTENGQAALEYRRIDIGAAGLVHASRTTGNNEALTGAKLA